MKITAKFKEYVEITEIELDGHNIKLKLNEIQAAGVFAQKTHLEVHKDHFDETLLEALKIVHGKKIFFKGKPVKMYLHGESEPFGNINNETGEANIPR